MEKIKKRLHWNNYHPPARPKLPIEPKKSFTTRERIALENEDFDGISFENIEIPAGFTYKDLEIIDEWNDSKYRLVVYLKNNKPNLNYEKEYLKYSKELVKYEEDIKNWEKEVIEYNAWKKQEENELLKRQIAEAKQFLKKHDNK
jgi:hypothetical protein